MAENGIQYSTGNTLNFTTNGTTWATLTSGGTFQVNSISATTTTAPFTTGSVIFQGSGGTLSQSNSNFFWDNTNGRLGINTNSPLYAVHAVGSNFRFGRAADATFDIANMETLLSAQQQTQVSS